MFDQLTRDLKYSLRTIFKRPGFAIAAILTLALGIGINTAIFTVVNAALLRPLPYQNSEALVHLWEINPRQDFGQMENSYPNFLDWRERNRVFSEIAGYDGDKNLTLIDRDQPTRLYGARVTANFFTTLAVEPALGRLFQPQEDFTSGERPIILSYHYWQSHFGGEATIINRKLIINGSPYTVIGVLPAQFHFAPAGPAEVWTPLMPNNDEKTERGYHWLTTIARLKPGVGIDEAQRDVDGITAQLAQEHPDTNNGIKGRVVLLRDQILGPVKTILLVLLATVLFVLLIACVNVANLLLTRANSRQREIAIRLALGAGRRQLVQQLLTESILLALIGGGIGLLLAQWGVDLLIRAIPASVLGSMPYLQQLSLDYRLLLFTVALSTLTGIVFGLAPALQALKTDLQVVLKEGGRSLSGSGSPRLGNLLVVAEIALALVLMVGAGLMVKSLSQLLQVNLGFNADSLLTLQLSPSPAKFREPQQVLQFHQQLLQQIETLPGVQGAATVTKLPVQGGGTTHFKIAGEPAPTPGNEPEANSRTVSSNYFTMMSVPLIQGRNFTADDRENTEKVMIVNQTLATRLFPKNDAIGRQLQIGSTAWQIIGVIGDEKVDGLDQATKPTVYTTFQQDPELRISLMIRTNNDPLSLVGAVRNEIKKLDSELPIYDVVTMKQFIDNTPQAFIRRYPAMVIGLFAFVALTLASIGIYGVLSYSVAQRAPEIGVRMALGAQRPDILKMVLREGLVLIVTGLAIGLVAALLLSRALGSLLYGVSAADPTIYLLVSGVLLVVALLACYIPAFRATRVDPMIAMRNS